MTSASSGLALRTALFQRLAADTALGALLGGPKIYDEPPRAAPPPYVALGKVETTDVSGDGASLHEHLVSLDVWSREGGLAEALKTADRVVRLLDGAGLALDGFRLANLVWRFTSADRAAVGGLRRAEVAFRAVTEPLE